MNPRKSAMEKNLKPFEEIQKILIGRVKRCFLNEADCYTVCTDFFHYKQNFFNYISVEESTSGNYDLNLGLWFDSLNSYFSKLTMDNLNEIQIINILREIAQDFN